ncbi:MAG: hypothetical protein J1F11_01275 [Oscillospiraceae bacterium]|nr:hypothetical protein [Oscillospiraceae bacterium]
MASSFMGLYVQRDALLLSQKSLDITGNNISNIHTAGYTRQRVDICSIANARGTLGYNTSVTLAGRGSQAIGVAQVRDRLLDKKVRDYSADLCNVGVRVNVLKDIEDLFDSIEADANLEYLDAASLTSMLSKLKSALEGFSADDASRTEIANIVINTAKSLAQGVNNIDQRLTDLCEQSLGDIRETVDRVNIILSQMGQLNQQIKNAYVSMGYISRTNNNYEVMKDYGPLELKDEMNKLLDELAQYGNIDFKEEDDGTFTVKFAGQVVVEGKKYAQMAMTEESPRSTELAFVITKAERDKDGEIIGGLYDKDDWYELHVANGTNGNGQDLVRKALKEYVGLRGEDIDLTNITGKRGAGSYYLDSGSLRGYLDMYNGRGAYADNAYSGGLQAAADAFQEFADKITAANTALGKLAGNPTGDDLMKIYDALKAIGAEFTFDDEKNEYLVKLNDVVIYDNTKGINKTLTFTPDENLNGVVSAGGQEIMTVSNSHQIVQRQVDLANNAIQKLLAANEAAMASTPPDLTKALDPAELNELIEILRSSVGAQLKIDEQTGDYAFPYSVEVNGVMILEGKTAKELKLRNPDEPNSLGNVEIYVDPSEEETAEQVKTANAALARLQQAVAAAKAKNRSTVDKGVLNEIARDLKNSIGVDIIGDKPEDYKVVLNGVTLFENGSVKETLAAGKDADGNPAYIVKGEPIPAKVDVVRTITTNGENGIEYYRDMLNAFVKTITEEFNKVYKGVEVQSNEYKAFSKDVELANAYLRELASGNISEGRKDVIEAAFKEMFFQGCDIEINDAGNGRYTVIWDGHEVLNADGEVTELRLVTDMGDPDPNSSTLMIGDERRHTITNYVTKNYEMFTFDTDNFRRAAETFRIADDWLHDPIFIADPTKDNRFEELDNIYVNKLLGIFSKDATAKLNYRDGFGHGEKNSFTLEQYIDHISGNLGDDIGRATFIYTDTDIWLTGLEEDRSGVMDVSMNEEGISMMNYQKWYNAISRMISTMDEALDKLINQTGLVGLR